MSEKIIPLGALLRTIYDATLLTDALYWHIKLQVNDEAHIRRVLRYAKDTISRLKRLREVFEIDGDEGAFDYLLSVYTEQMWLAENYLASMENDNNKREESSDGKH
jgi:hypothetical protein